MSDRWRGRHTVTEMNMRVATITAAQGKRKKRLTSDGKKKKFHVRHHKTPQNNTKTGENDTGV